LQEQLGLKSITDGEFHARTTSSISIKAFGRDGIGFEPVLSSQRQGRGASASEWS
jgi:hypothetical protein